MARKYTRKASLKRRTRKASRRSLGRKRGGRGGAGGLGGASVGHGDGGFGGRADFGSVDNRAGTLPVNQQQTQQQEYGSWFDKAKSLLSGGKRNTRRNRRSLRNKRN